MAQFITQISCALVRGTKKNNEKYVTNYLTEILLASENKYLPVFQNFIHFRNVICQKSGEFGENYIVMNCLFRACSAAILSRTGDFVGSVPSWKTRLNYVGIKTVNLELLLTRLHAECYSTGKGSGRKSRTKILDPKPVLEPEKDALFVVRKGDIVGVYKSLSDCQAQVGSSICDPPVSVYKGYCMPRDTEEYILSCGLKNALYSIRAADLKADLFGDLTPCPFQQPSSSINETVDKDKKRSQELMEAEMWEAKNPLRKHIKLEPGVMNQVQSSGRSCIVEFDGASKGKSGQAGAGAVLRADDGRMIQGLWKVRNPSTSDLYEEAKKLTDRFLSFEISHVLRDLNSDADAEANFAACLADGQIEEIDV